LEVIDHIKASTWHTTHTPRIKKLSAVFGERNDIYEAALKTHMKHNDVHGYEMDILRERIVGSYWSKPAYMLAQVVEELAKPEGKRNDWLVYVLTTSYPNIEHLLTWSQMGRSRHHRPQP